MEGQGQPRADDPPAEGAPATASHEPEPLLPADLLALGAFPNQDDTADARLLTLQKELQEAQTKAATALPQLGDSSEAVKAKLQHACERSRVTVAVVSPRLPPPSLGVTAAQFTQLLARGGRPARNADPAACAAGLGEDVPPLKDQPQSLLPQGVHARALDVHVPNVVEAMTAIHRYELDATPPEWSEWSRLVIVALTPAHMVAEARELLRRAALHEKGAEGVYVAMRAAASEEARARAEGALMAVARAAGLPAARVTVLPYDDTADSNPGDNDDGVSPPANESERQLFHGEDADSVRLSEPANTFENWCQLLQKSAMACVEETLTESLAAAQELLPIVNFWACVHANPSRPGTLATMLLMKAVEGIPKVNLSGAAAIAAQHKKSNPDLKHSAVSGMVNTNSAITFTSGFLTGLGGFVTFPVAVPTALGIALLLRLRVCLAIAILGGYSDLDPQAITGVLLCVFGADATPLIQPRTRTAVLVEDAARQREKGTHTKAIEAVTDSLNEAVDKINPDMVVQHCELGAALYAERVKSVYLSKFEAVDEATSSAADSIADRAYRTRLPLEVMRVLPGVMFARVSGNVMAYSAEMVPVVGGVISGGVDAGLTKAAGHAAMKQFLPRQPNSGVVPLEDFLSDVDRPTAPTEPAPPTLRERGDAAMSQAKVAADKAAAEARVAAEKASEWAKSTNQKVGTWAAGLWAKVDTGMKNYPSYK